MSSKDIFALPNMIENRKMIITTPNTREIHGQSPSSFMEMWTKAVQPPVWEERVAPPEMQGMDIVLVFQRPGYGRCGKQVIGSMRQKKQRRHVALHPIAVRKLMFKNCHPVAISMDQAAPDTVDQTASFTFHGM